MSLAANQPDALRLAASRRASSLRMGEVHVWSIKLQDGAGLLSDHAILLSNAELRRADSFRFEIDRRRFIAARGTLRRLLAAYTGGSARSLEIETTKYGKPFLANQSTPLDFNLAHSADRALIALSPDSALGVDLEDLSHEPRVADLTESICSLTEQRELAALPEAIKPRALLRLWTAKEAFLKSTGFGLQVNPTRLAVASGVAVGSRGTSSIHWIDEPGSSSKYCLYPFPECETIIGASAALVAARMARPHHIVWIDADAHRRPNWADEE